MSTPEEQPTSFEESPMRNWIHTDSAPDAPWRWFARRNEGRSQWFRQEVFGEWLDEPPDLRWMSDPSAPMTTPLGDLISEKDFPLRVRKHRQYLDTVFVVVGDRGGWIAEVRDECVAHWIVRTVNDHWTEKKSHE